MTAAQARALRNGTSQVQILGTREHPSTYRMNITPAFRVTSTTAEIQAQLKAGKLKVAGPTTITSHKAIELIPIHGPYGYVLRRRTRHLLPDQAGLPDTRYHGYHCLQRISGASRDARESTAPEPRRPPPRRPHRPQPRRLPGR